MNNMSKHFYIQAIILSAINVVGWLLVLHNSSFLFVLGIVLVLLSFIVFLFLLIKKQKKEKHIFSQQSILQKSIKKNNILIFISLFLLLGCITIVCVESFIKRSFEFIRIINILPFIIILIALFYQKKQLNKQREIHNNNYE
jgi:Ca2+/Na+ antiporter